MSEESEKMLLDVGFDVHPRTNSAEWLIEQHKKRLERKAKMTAEEKQAALEKVRSYWAIPEKRDEYNEHRRVMREKARDDLMKKTGVARVVGRPAQAPPPAPMGAAIAQSEYSNAQEYINKFMDYTEIAVPAEYKDIGFAFNDTSEHPKIILPEKMSDYAFLNHYSAFADLKPDMRRDFLAGFRDAMECAGYTMPAEVLKTKDPLKYTEWYTKTDVDPFKVVKFSTTTFGVAVRNNAAHGITKGVTPLSRSQQHGQATGLGSITTQGLLLCLHHTQNAKEGASGFASEMCQKLLRDQFIYEKFGKWAREQSKIHFKTQVQTEKDVKNTMPWEEWVAKAKVYISKSFNIKGKFAGDINIAPANEAFNAKQLEQLRNAVLVACLSLVPNIRYAWKSLRIRPSGYEKSGGESLKENYVTVPTEPAEMPRFYFNTTKIGEALRRLAQTPHNISYENVFDPIRAPDSPLFLKIVKSWLKVTPNREWFLPKDFGTHNEEAASLSELFNKTILPQVSPTKRFMEGLQRREYINWFEEKFEDWQRNSVKNSVAARLMTHHFNEDTRKSYVKTKTVPDRVPSKEAEPPVAKALVVQPLKPLAAKPLKPLAAKPVKPLARKQLIVKENEPRSSGRKKKAAIVWDE